jgi:flagellar biogenesis protein FliO
MNSYRVFACLLLVMGLGLLLSPGAMAEDYRLDPSGPKLSTPSPSPAEHEPRAAVGGTSARDTTSGEMVAAESDDSAPPAKSSRRPPSARRRNAPRTPSRERTSVEDEPAAVSAEQPPPAEMVASAEEPSGEETTKPWLRDHYTDADRNTNPGATATTSSKTLGMAVGLGFKLGLVVLLAYLCALLVRKVAQRRGALKVGGGVLRVVESAALAPNRGLHIVAVGNRAFLVGSTPEQFSVLGEVSDVAQVAELVKEADASDTLADRLREWLHRQKPSARSRDPLVEQLRSGADSLRDRATQRQSQFDNTLQAAIDEASRR